MRLNKILTQRYSAYSRAGARKKEVKGRDVGKGELNCGEEMEQEVQEGVRGGVREEGGKGALRNEVK